MALQEKSHKGSLKGAPKKAPVKFSLTSEQHKAQNGELIDSALFGDCSLK